MPERLRYPWAAGWVGVPVAGLQMLHQTAALGSPMVFLFTDNEVKEEGFLEYVNMILTAGEIPGLHSKEDLEVAPPPTSISHSQEHW